MEGLARAVRISPNVREKANELIRRSEAKGSFCMEQTCLMAVCVDLACRTLSEPVNKERLQKYSGTQAKTYTKNLQVIEKLLNLDRGGTLHDLVIRFGCPEAKDPAQQILTSYKQYFASKYTLGIYKSIDFNSTLYSAAALSTTCRLLKIRIDQSKLSSITSTSKTVFRKITEDMHNNVPESLVEKVRGMKKKKRKTKYVEGDGDTEDVLNSNDEGVVESTVPQVYSEWPTHFQLESFDSRCLSNPFTRDFDIWKEKMLNKAMSDKQDK